MRHWRKTFFFRHLDLCSGERSGEINGTFLPSLTHITSWRTAELEFCEYWIVLPSNICLKVVVVLFNCRSICVSIFVSGVRLFKMVLGYQVWNAGYYNKTANENSWFPKNTQLAHKHVLWWVFYLVVKR